MRTVFPGLVLVLVFVFAVGCSQNEGIQSDIHDGRVSRDWRSLVGIDSMQVYASVHILGQDMASAGGRIEDQLTQRLDTAGIGITRTPFVFNAGYVSVWIDGYPATVGGDTANPHVFFSAIMQLDRYTQIRHTKELKDEEPKLSLSTTWKKFGAGSCPLDSFEVYAGRLVDIWTDTLLTEHVKAQK